MKHCESCGKELSDKAVVCPFCGDATNRFFALAKPYSYEKMGLAIASLICSVIIPFIGLILGIVGVCKYETDRPKLISVMSIPISLLAWAFYGLWIYIAFILAKSGYRYYYY